MPSPAGVSSAGPSQAGPLSGASYVGPLNPYEALFDNAAPIVPYHAPPLESHAQEHPEEQQGSTTLRLMNMLVVYWGSLAAYSPQ